MQKSFSIVNILVVLCAIFIIILIGEVAYLFFSSHSTRPKQIVMVPTPTIVTRVFNSLPQYASGEKGVITLDIKKTATPESYVLWKNGDFYYYQIKGSKPNLAPSVMTGTVQSIQNKKLMIYAIDGQDNKYNIGLELAANGQVVGPDSDISGSKVTPNNSANKLSLESIKIGDKIKAFYLTKNPPNADHYTANNIIDLTKHN